MLAPFYDGGYAIGAGTSFSAPFVSGQCALILSLNPDAVVQTVYCTVGLGVVGIYQIPENEPYQGKLGSGRFDGMATWVTSPKTADVGGTGLASARRLELFPNPARVEQGVSFRLGSADARSRLIVFDATGRRVQTIETGSAGLARWNGRDASGKRVPPGVYFVRADGGSLQGRIVLNR